VVLALPRAPFPTSDPQSARIGLPGFEAMTVDRAGTTVTAASENALAQDGPAISDQVGSASRVLRLDPATGADLGEFVYEVDPVRLAPGEAFTPVSSANGIGEILAIDDSDYLTVEHNVSAAGGFSGKLYRTSIHGARERHVADDNFGIAGKTTFHLLTVGR